jgi:hypothetical protein
MFCLPACQACRVAGTCPKGEVPATPVSETKPAKWAPNELRMVAMPCGCICIPWPILHILGESIERFLCSKHGEVKISKSWLNRTVKDEVSVTDPLVETIPF